MDAAVVAAIAGPAATVLVAAIARVKLREIHTLVNDRLDAALGEISALRRELDRDSSTSDALRSSEAEAVVTDA